MRSCFAITLELDCSERFSAPGRKPIAKVLRKTGYAGPNFFSHSFIHGGGSSEGVAAISSLGGILSGAGKGSGPFNLSDTDHLSGGVSRWRK